MILSCIRCRFILKIKILFFLQKRKSRSVNLGVDITCQLELNCLLRCVEIIYGSRISLPRIDIPIRVRFCHLNTLWNYSYEVILLLA